MKNTENKWGRRCALADVATSVARVPGLSAFTFAEALLAEIFAFSARSVVRYNALPRKEGRNGPPPPS